MLGNCGLTEDINKCPHFIADKRGCGADHKECGFFEPFERAREIKEPAMRGPKWFEQYYK